MKYSSLLANTPQSKPLNHEQVQNNAGGFVFAIDDWTRLDRFLVLGSAEGTYYQTARALTRENAACVERCYKLDHERTVARIVEISDAGRAPKNDPAVFALALGAASNDTATRQKALAALPKVCRTGTHLFQFVGAVRALGRGWGRTLKRAVGNWYDAKSVDSLAYQAIKYRSRESYTHKRLLQTAHPKGNAERAALYQWLTGKEVVDPAALPALVQAHLAAMKLAAGKELTELIKTHKLPWEAIPTETTTAPGIWQAMLPDMGLTALVRNLGAMTAYGALKPMEPEAAIVARRLADKAAIRKARVHPFALLQALAVYRSGRGVRGKLSWDPIGPVIDALDQAFYLAFDNVEPTGKRIMIALDVSGSMGSPMMGSPLSVREAAAAMGLTVAKTEPAHHIVAFSAGMVDAWVANSRGRYGWHASSRNGDGISPLPITPRMRLDDAVRLVTNLPFGATDCALPMLYAAAKGLSVDAFLVITDNETWAGSVHPVEALRRYRQATGIPAKLVVIGMTSTGFSIADPNDAGMLDVVGFDASCPNLIADFIRN